MIIVMGHPYTLTDPDLMQLRPIIQSMVEEGKITVLEDYLFSGYALAIDGLALVLHKI